MWTCEVLATELAGADQLAIRVISSTPVRTGIILPMTITTADQKWLPLVIQSKPAATCASSWYGVLCQLTSRSVQFREALLLKYDAP